MRREDIGTRRGSDYPEKLSQISAIEERDGARNMLDTFVWGRRHGILSVNNDHSG